MHTIKDTNEKWEEVLSSSIIQTVDAGSALLELWLFILLAKGDSKRQGKWHSEIVTETPPQRSGRHWHNKQKLVLKIFFKKNVYH